LERSEETYRRNEPWLDGEVRKARFLQSKKPPEYKKLLEFEPDFYLRMLEK